GTTMKLLHPALAATLITGGLVVPATSLTVPTQPSEPRPVPAAITTTALTGVDDVALREATGLPSAYRTDPGSTLSGASTADADRVVAFTGELEVPEFDLVGVTWAGDSAVSAADVAVTVRVREQGTWTDWTQLGVPDLAPDDDV